MKVWMLQQVLNLFLPILIGTLVPPIMRGLKAVATKVDALPPAMQQGIVVILAGAGNALASFLNVQLTGDIFAWTDTDMRAIISAAVAFASHAGLKAKEAKAHVAAVRAEWAHKLDQGESPFVLPGSSPRS